jgi:uncharacterized protein (TIGR03067 family)
MKRLLPFAILAVAVSACADSSMDVAAGLDKAPTDKERIQGTWVFASLEMNGAVVTEGNHYIKAKDMKWSFAGDCFHNSAVGDDVEATFNVYPDKSPGSLDIHMKANPRTMTLRMLYELKGDVLRLCYDLVPDAARPEEVAARDSYVILTLKRAKRPAE